MQILLSYVSMHKKFHLVIGFYFKRKISNIFTFFFHSKMAANYTEIGRVGNLEADFQ